MEYNHSDNYDIKLGKAFKTGFIINITFIIAEILFGFLSKSMALLADAGHNLIDVLGLALSWIAIVLSNREATLKYTYGFRRTTILVAVINTVLLLMAVVFIIYETIGRLNHPVEINTNNVIIVATTGICVNAFTSWLFIKMQKHDLNIRSAFVHFTADALVSLGVVIAGITIAITGILWIDSLVSFAIIAVILYSSYNLLINSVNLSLDAVPENVNIKEVREFFEEYPEVADVHDLHIWALGTNVTALTVHLTTSEQTDVSFITSINHQLNERFGIEHTTIQVEFEGRKDTDNKMKDL